MGRAIDLFVTYRFIRLLTTPFEKSDAYAMGIIDKNGFSTDKKLIQKQYDVEHLLQEPQNLSKIQSWLHLGATWSQLGAT